VSHSQWGMSLGAGIHMVWLQYPELHRLCKLLKGSRTAVYLMTRCVETDRCRLLSEWWTKLPWLRTATVQCPGLLPLAFSPQVPAAVAGDLALGRGLLKENGYHHIWVTGSWASILHSVPWDLSSKISGPTRSRTAEGEHLPFLCFSVFIGFLFSFPLVKWK
jgi:hypothetical protein